MFKVLHLRSSAGFWGPERQIGQLIAPMRGHGFEIEVLVLYRHRPGLPRIHPLVTAVGQQEGQASQINGRWRDLPGNVLAVARKLRSRRYALLHTHEYKSDLIGGLAARLTGVPAVASVRGYTDRTLLLRLYKHIDLRVLRCFDRILPVADHVRRQLLDAGLPSQRVITLYDAIDPRSFGIATDTIPVKLWQELGLNGSSKVVSIIGRLSLEKGHRYLLEGVGRILERFPETHFLIAGDGPERGRLEWLATRLGVNHAVSFLGYRSDVATIVAVSDVVVLASLREGCPNALIEAMSLGRPVVATSVGGVPEIARHGETGLLVPPRDPGAIAQAVLRLLRDPAWASRLGINGRQVMMQGFHIDVLAQRLASVYRELLEQRVAASSGAFVRR